MSADESPPAPATASDSDAMLVERTVAGDQKAFELLVIKYERRIQRLIGRLVQDRTAAQWKVLDALRSVQHRHPGTHGTQKIATRKRR